MLPTHIGGGSGQGGGVNANNFTTNDPESGGGLSHSFIDDNDENKYRTKEKSFLPPGGTHMRQLFLFLFTQKKARVAFEVVRFFVVALFFRWLVVKVVFEDGNEDEDHPGSVLSTSKTGGGGKRYSNNNKNENKYHHSLLDGEDNMFSDSHWTLRVLWERLHARWRGKFVVSRRVSDARGNGKRFGRTD